MPADGSGSDAVLLSDHGAAATDAESFYRSPQFLSAEGVTHTLVIGEGGPAIPLIVREIDGGGRDAISPYGYPGGSLTASAPPDPASVDWSACDLVSVFVRDRVGTPRCLAGGRERGRVVIADPSQPSGIRKRLREQIRSAEREGWSVRSIPGPEVAAPELDAFHAAYSQTMARTGAAERYLYAPEYLRGLLDSPTTTLFAATSPEGEPAAGAIMVSGDGLLHYHLGGTLDAALAASPMKSLFAAMIAASAEAETPLNLGGGVAAGDSLERFKAGFGNSEAAFVTHEVICDPAAYERLTASSATGSGSQAGEFFPAYRA